MAGGGGAPAHDTLRRQGLCSFCSSDTAGPITLDRLLQEPARTEFRPRPKAGLSRCEPPRYLGAKPHLSARQEIGSDFTERRLRRCLPKGAKRASDPVDGTLDSALFGVCLRELISHVAGQIGYLVALLVC